MVKWSNPENRVAPSLGVVANEKGALESPLTTITNFTYFILFLSREQMI